MTVANRLALLGLAMALGCAPKTAELSPADVAAIRHRFDEVARHVTAKDYAAWANDFTEDAVFMFANSPAVRGRAAIQKWGEAGPKAERLTFSDVQIQGSGNTVWGTSAYAFKIEGAPAADIGKQLVVFRRQPDGSWLSLAASVSSDLPATQPSPAPPGGDPFLGTWKFIPDKSKFDPGPAPKTNIARYKASEGGLTQTADGTDANGNPTHSVLVLRFDGKEYPVQGIAYADTAAFTRADPYTITSIWKNGGQVMLRATNVVSRDGKTRTITQTGKDAQGRAVNNVIVFEKQ